MLLPYEKEWNLSINKNFGKFLKEVNDEERIDFIFGRIDSEVSPKESPNDRRGVSFSDIQEFYSKRRVPFALFRLPQDILYQESGGFIQRIFEFFSKMDLQVEFRSFGLEKFKIGEIKHYHFLAVYKKEGLSFLFNTDFALNNSKVEQDFVNDYGYLDEEPKDLTKVTAPIVLDFIFDLIKERYLEI